MRCPSIAELQVKLHAALLKNKKGWCFAFEGKEFILSVPKQVFRLSDSKEDKAYDMDDGAAFSFVNSGRFDVLK